MGMRLRVCATRFITQMLRHWHSHILMYEMNSLLDKRTYRHARDPRIYRSNNVPKRRCEIVSDITYAVHLSNK